MIYLSLFLDRASCTDADNDPNFQLDCFPPVESTDLLFYLVLETSFFTQQQFKAFRSLQSDGFGIYNQRERPHHRKQVCCVSQGDTYAENE